MQNNLYRSTLGVAATVLLIGCGSPHSGTTLDATPQGGSNVPTDSAVTGAPGVPDVPLGAPIQAADGVWTYVPFPSAYCRDGSAAHLMVHLNSASKKIAIYLEGGGACFNDVSCALLTSDPPSYLLGQGVFNFSRADNPIGDWNIFYVPYCTGDAHGGSNPAGVPGPIMGAQNYTGYSNLKLYLSRILATVPDATDELLTGVSAGGFGAGLTSDLVNRNAPASVQRLTMLDDSGPPMSSQYVVPCLQDMWRKVWGLDNTILKDCGEECPTKDDYMMDWVHFVTNKYGQGTSSRFRAGLLSHSNDSVVSVFYGFGAANCTALAPTPMANAQFEAGLLDFRSTMQAQTDKFGAYFADGSAHTFLALDGAAVLGIALGGLYDTEVNGVKLTDWISALLDRTSVSNVGP
jgi:hypothetical protein